MRSFLWAFYNFFYVQSAIVIVGVVLIPRERGISWKLSEAIFLYRMQKNRSSLNWSTECLFRSNSALHKNVNEFVWINPSCTNGNAITKRETITHFWLTPIFFIVFEEGTPRFLCIWSFHSCIQACHRSFVFQLVSESILANNHSKLV